MKRKIAYLGTEEAERERNKPHFVSEDEPDMLYPGVPNYEKFERKGWDVDKTLSWLNID